MELRNSTKKIRQECNVLTLELWDLYSPVKISFKNQRLLCRSLALTFYCSFTFNSLGDKDVADSIIVIEFKLRTECTVL